MTKAFENFLDESYVQPMDLNILDMFILIHREQPPNPLMTTRKS